MPSPYEKLKEIWSAKIDSLESFTAAVQRSAGISSTPTFGSGNLPYPSGYTYTVAADKAWWLRRELMREKVGVYPEPSSVITGLRATSAALFQYFPHISRDDPNMIAFTPDAEKGAKDVQVRTTLGKYLRKHFLCVTDTWIAKVEAEHKAEISGEFLVATTVEEIERVYTTMAGDSGCMRHPKTNWSFPFHPSAVYSAPGVGVAYLEDTENRIIARTVIYQNPDNPDDKRYVRLYGDHMRLEAKLKRQGFVLAGLAGVKLKLIKLDESKFGADQYICPYLDAPGGGSGNGKHDGGYVVRDGDLNLRVISQKEAQDIADNQSGSYCNARNTAARVTLTNPIDPRAGLVNCLLTGVEFHRTNGQAVVLADGRVGWVTSAEFNKMGDVGFFLYHFTNGKKIRHYCTEDVFSRYRWQDSPLYNSDENLTACGYPLLSEDFYEAGTRKQASYVVTDAAGRKIAKSDAVRAYTAAGDLVLYHEKDAAKMLKAGWVRAAPKSEERYIVEANNPRAHKLVSGRIAIQGVHDIVCLTSGEWVYSRNATQTRYFGFRVCIPRADERRYEISKQAFKNLVTTAFNIRKENGPATYLNELRTDAVLLQWVKVGFRGNYSYQVMANGELGTVSPYQVADLSAIKAVLTTEFTDEQLVQQVGSYCVALYKEYVASLRNLLEAYDEVLAEFIAAEAAAAASASVPLTLTSADSTMVVSTGSGVTRVVPAGAVLVALDELTSTSAEHVQF